MNDGSELIVDVQSRVIYEKGDNSPFLTFGVSWYAYLSLIKTLLFRLLFAMFIGLGLHYALQAYTGKPSNWIVTVVFATAVLSLAYDILYLKSIFLFTDDSGVWVQQGVFPWEKGVSGVKWRDVSEASYQPGLVSWALKCHSVRVGHRFTNGAEIYVNHIKHGDLAVQHINQIAIGIAGRL